MQTLTRYIASRTYRPALERYLSSTRIYHSRGFNITVPSGIFHPGFFFSTQLLHSFLQAHDLAGLDVLDLGSGSGFLGIAAARKDARVCAVDINPAAVSCTQQNAVANKVSIITMQSDLFNALTGKRFDLILINPPYYMKNARNDAELAWCCGSDGAYFQRLFAQLGDHLKPNGRAVMTLCDQCDLERIANMASFNGTRLEILRRRKTIFETHFLFELKPWSEEC